MLLIGSPAALSGSMGLKGAASSGTEAYKCWSLTGLCFLLPAGVGMKSSVRRGKKKKEKKKKKKKEEEEEERLYVLIKGTTGEVLCRWREV